MSNNFVKPARRRGLKISKDSRPLKTEFINNIKIPRMHSHRCEPILNIPSHRPCSVRIARLHHQWMKSRTFSFVVISEKLSMTGKVWMTDHKVEPRIWDIEECPKAACFCKQLLSLEHSKGIILSTLASNLSETTAGYTMFSLLQQTVSTSLNKCRSHFKKQFLTSCYHQTTETVHPRGLGDIRWVKNFVGNRISEAPKLCKPFLVQNLRCYIHQECDNHSSGNTSIEEGITFSFVPRIHRRKDPFWATRVGEAANPGPEAFRFAIINPTAILGKIQDICTLNAHVISLSENSKHGENLVSNRFGANPWLHITGLSRKTKQEEDRQVGLPYIA